MKFRLNNNDEQYEGETLSVTGLLAFKNYTFKMLIVKINGNIVKREDYPATMVHEGDEVFVLHLMSGG